MFLFTSHDTKTLQNEHNYKIMTKRLNLKIKYYLKSFDNVSQFKIEIHDANYNHD